VTDLEASRRDVGHILSTPGKELVHARDPDAKVSVDAGEITLAAATLDDEEEEHNEKYPTDEEKRTLRKVAGPVSYAGYLLCAVECANNASYYGVTGVFANFIQRPLPEGGNGWVSYPASPFVPPA
jgi:hypothetical protein